VRPMADDENALPTVPKLELAQWRYLVVEATEAPASERAAAKARLLDAIALDSMDKYYEELCEALKETPDAALLAKMKAANKTRVEEFDAKITDAKANLGDTEVREAMLAKADFLATTGHKADALTAYRECAEKTIPIGQRLDLVFTQIRLGFFYNDTDLVTRNIDKAKVLIEEGGDWDRRNRLKVTEAYNAMARRQFERAATHLVDALATFSSYELFSYEKLVFYAVVSAAVTLDRVSLKKKVIDAPETITAIHRTPGLKDFLHAFYDGEYALFLKSLLTITDQMNLDRALAPHIRWFSREMRIRAYGQFLESYRSVQLQSMATHFGISPELLDRELSRFVAVGRLACKIDKVGGVIETNRPNNRNAQYATVIKNGDALLNRVQKLSRVINL